MLLPLGLQFNEHPEKAVSVENALNMQPEVSNGGRGQIILRSVPGLLSWSSVNPDANAGRGAVVANDLLYAVIGKKFWSVTSAGVATEIGRIDGTERVGIAASSDEVFIATGVGNYVYNIAGGTLSSVVGAPNGRTVAFINGRFVMEDPEATGASAGRFYWSDLMDGTTWNALNYATAEQKPDRTNGVAALGNTLIVYGEGSVEFWRGNANGFVPITGSSKPIGLVGKFAFAERNGVLCWLGANGAVWVLSGGYQPVQVSTTSVEADLSLDSSTECVAYYEQGHLVFEFSTSSRTLCYDHTQSQRIGKYVWFEKSDGGSRSKISAYVFAYGKPLVLSTSGGVIYELSRDAYPDVREFVIPTVSEDQERPWMRLDAIELLCRTGSGDIPSDDPKVMMQISKDNGYTWGEEHWIGMGTIGHYEKRAKWRRLGRFTQMALKFRMTDQVDWTVMGLNARGR